MKHRTLNDTRSKDIHARPAAGSSVASISVSHDDHNIVLGELSGAPVVLSTSSHLMGELIGEPPTVPVLCLYRNGLDLLVRGDLIVRRAP